MDKKFEDFLSYYNSELTFINHNAEQFAKNNPKIAAQLQISPNARPDPHVERLIQSVAFLNARMHYKIDDDMADAASALLSTLMPNFLAPIPSLSVAQFNVDETVDKIQTIERHRELEFLTPNTEHCIFRTAYDTEVLPVEIKAAKLVAAATKDDSLNEEDSIKSLLNIKLATINPAATFSKMAPKKLRFFISADEAHAYALYDLIMKGTVTLVLATSDTDPNTIRLQADKHIRQVGFELDEALFPYKKNAFTGYRLLTELFVFPRKFLFFDIVGITPEMLAHVKNELQLFFYLKDSNKDIENFVTKNFFALNCTPIVNLFTKTMEPINNDWREPEYRIVTDAHSEAHYDIYDIQSVTAVFGDGKQMQLDPFYAIRRDTADNENAIFWNTRRV
ncbi:MAG: type VI secretion system baseplate subunit TssF, partial [Gammaproteobacteria bacterium]|nr:type VI secretion system baseplate subunit TssF [Gammaproteobacteria bacterium]